MSEVGFDLARVVDEDGAEHPAFHFVGGGVDVHTRIEDAVLIGSLEELDHASYAAVMRLVETILDQHVPSVQA